MNETLPLFLKSSQWQAKSHMNIKHSQWKIVTEKINCAVSVVVFSKKGVLWRLEQISTLSFFVLIKLSRKGLQRCGRGVEVQTLNAHLALLPVSLISHHFSHSHFTSNPNKDLRFSEHTASSNLFSLTEEPNTINTPFRVLILVYYQISFFTPECKHLKGRDFILFTTGSLLLYTGLGIQ